MNGCCSLGGVRLSFWIPMRNRDCDKSQMELGPTGLTSSDTHTLFSSIILFCRNRSSCFMCVSHQHSQTFMSASFVALCPLKTCVWRRVGFGILAGADRARDHNAGRTLCQRANGTLEKTQSMGACWRGTCVTSGGKYGMDTGQREFF